jgi:hypothetical protein
LSSRAGSSGAAFFMDKIAITSNAERDFQSWFITFRLFANRTYLGGTGKFTTSPPNGGPWKTA